MGSWAEGLLRPIHEEDDGCGQMDFRVGYQGPGHLQDDPDTGGIVRSTCVYEGETFPSRVVVVAAVLMVVVVVVMVVVAVVMWWWYLKSTKARHFLLGWWWWRRC
jgi:hypothetical protein